MRRFDSDPRLQVVIVEHQGVAQVGTATVSETVSKRVREFTTRHHSAEPH